MKKVIFFIISAAVILGLCSCGIPEDYTKSDIAEGSLESGSVISVHGVGELTFNRIYTSDKIYATVKSGNFYENADSENHYIDLVFRFKNRNSRINCNDIGYVSALGKSSGKEYKENLIAAESADSRNMSANAAVEPNETVTLHIAVTVPKEGDDRYDISLYLKNGVYKLTYSAGDYDSDSDTVYEGQSISNSKLKAKICSAEYSDTLFENASSAKKCPENYIYLVTELQVMNKSIESKSAAEAVSVSAMYDEELFTAEYYMTDGDKSYTAGGVIDGLSTENILAVIYLPIEYSRRDAKLLLAIDYEEFVCGVDGTDNFVRKKELEKIRQEEAQAEARRQAAEAASRAAAEKNEPEGESAKEQAGAEGSAEDVPDGGGKADDADTGDPDGE